MSLDLLAIKERLDNDSLISRAAYEDMQALIDEIKRLRDAQEAHDRLCQGERAIS